MKKLIIAILAVCSMLSGAQTYKRPTGDSYVSGVGSYCSGGTVQSNSTSLSAAYSGKSGAGPTGSSASLAQASTLVTGSYYTTRTFTPWQSGTLSTAILYASLACTNDDAAGFGMCGLSFSTNGGASWTNWWQGTAFYSTQTTYSISLGSVDLSQLRVMVCAKASFDTPESMTTTTNAVLYDLWVAGTESTTNRKLIWFTN